MLTHADDYRIMTDSDMKIVKKLSSLIQQPDGTNTDREIVRDVYGYHAVRLMASIRLLLAHIEGIKNGAIVVVERLSSKRDPPRNDMTDVYDEGYDACREDALKALRGEQC